MSKDTATLRSPDRQCLGAFLLYGSLLLVLWVIVYGGVSWLTGTHSYRLQLGFEAEKAIPFVPEAVLIYLSLFPMIWLSLFILRTPGELKVFAKTLAWLYVVSGAGFILFPADASYSPPARLGVIRPIFEFADRINLDYNFLPSLHVGMAVVCAYIYQRRLSSTAAALCWIWAGAIALSTLLTHQHYIADVLAGGAVGYIVAVCNAGQLEQQAIYEAVTRRS